MRLSPCVALLPLLVACGSSPPAPTPAPAPVGPLGGAPPTKKVDAADSYHGTTVADPYRWLEASHDQSPEVKAFIDGQNTHARAFLDGLPERAFVHQRLSAILGSDTVGYGVVGEHAGVLYALKLEPPKPQRMLVALRSPDDLASERVVLDPNTLDPSGKTAIDFVRVSPDGKHVAVSLSAGGSETGDLHVFETATGKAAFEVVPGVNAGTAGGDVAWLADSKGFYYSRYPRGDERPADDKLFYVQLYRHMLGTPTSEDVYELGKDFPRIAEVFADVAPNGDVLCTVQKGDGGEFELHLQLGGYQKGGPWVKLAAFEDDLVQGFFGPKDDLYVVSRKDAPKGKLLRGKRKGFSLAKLDTIIPEGEGALVSDIWSDHVLAIHGGRIYATFQLGGPSEVRVFDLAGKPQKGPELLPVSASGEIVPLGKSDVLFAQTSFLAPAGWYRFAPGAGKTTKTTISSKSPVDLVAMGVTVTREMARSKDGTQVPVNILMPPGAVKGQPVPFVVTGYGGYGVNIEPAFQALRSVFLEKGIGLAVVNLRGGGEFGEAWHEDGMLTKKQNVFDDFIGAVEHLVQAGYARAGRVGIIGGSNGGLLMGAVMTQRPELFAAVASYVGIYDMLRVELEPNGAFNTTEFGTVANPEHFAALYAYSPYHRVVDGTVYPPTFFFVGANDVRVAPWQSRKMIARLQAAAGSAAPLLMVTAFDSGHGVGSSIQQVVDQNADGFGFLMHHLLKP
ncbi:MAG: S9 family peptidase [Deltaproteobacteria bacterium]|nr:S9 family peptidase [Deltaproteobacteria bacterium]